MKKRRAQLKLVNFKATREERRALRRQARKYTNGVQSEYLRLAIVSPQKLLTSRRKVA